MKKNQKRAVTLMELIVVVVIIGILAGLMLPSYTRSRERAMDKQAQALLSLIRAAERTYRMETGVYYPASASVTRATDVNAINSNLSLDLVLDNWGQYSLCSGGNCYIEGSAGGGSFKAYLARDKGSYDRYWYINNTLTNATCLGSKCP